MQQVCNNTSCSVKLPYSLSHCVWNQSPLGSLVSAKVFPSLPNTWSSYERKNVRISPEEWLEWLRAFSSLRIPILRTRALWRTSRKAQIKPPPLAPPPCWAQFARKKYIVPIMAAPMAEDTIRVSLRSYRPLLRTNGITIECYGGRENFH